MKHIIRKLLRLQQETGQSVVIMAGAMLALMALVGLTVDAGNAYVQQRVVQNATEAATLAATSELAVRGTWDPVTESYIVSVLDEREILRKALEVAEENRVPDTAPGDDYVNDNLVVRYVDASGNPVLLPLGNNIGALGVNGIQVRSNLPFDTFFTRLIGFNSMETNATTRALVGAAGSTTMGFPMTVDEETVRVNCAVGPCEIHEPPKKKFGPGNFGWLDWDGPPVGVPELAQDMHDGDGNARVNDWIPGNPGNKCNSQLVRDELDSRIPGYNGGHDHGEDGQYVIMPIHDEVVDSGSNLTYHIIGFAKFKLLSYHCGSGGESNGQGGQDIMYIRGEFVEWVDSDADIVPGAEDFSGRTIKLSAP